jgi:thiol-disulfide isomerase/thioredoxin
MMNFRLLLILAGVLFLAIVVGALRRRPGQSVSATKSPIDFTLQDLHGKPMKLSSYRGKVVVVDVWATWCPYCVSEIPDLLAAQQQAVKAGTPLQFLGIAMDDNIADVRTFAAKQHFNYPILYKDDTQMRPFGSVEGLPTKFIIDKHGDIVDEIDGTVPIKTLLQHIAPYLKTAAS